jgi:hypothetical protein
VLSRLRAWLRHRHHPNTVVLGTEVAAAERTERSHRRRAGKTPSPLAGVTYGAGEASLEQLQPSHTDARIRQFVAEYRTANAPSRQAIRDALTMDDFYTLLTFARRSTVSAVRAKDPAILRDGVDSLAAIDQQRVDPRDHAWAAALVAWASRHVGLDARTALGQAADLGSPETAEMLRRFAEDPPDDLTGWGYRLVDGADGAALVRDDGREYDPSVDLLAVARAIAAVFVADAYERADVTLGSDLPEVWLRNGDQAAVERALATMRAGASIAAQLASDAHRKPDDQMLAAFLAEVRDAESASVLAASASCPDGDALGVAAGRLCCVVVGHSFVAQTRSFESPGALERFRDAIHRELERAH